MQGIEEVETAEADEKAQDAAACDKEIPEGLKASTRDDLVRTVHQ